MRVERIDPADFSTLADCWNCLTQGVPFRSWHWAQAWWKHFAAGRELFVLTVRDGRGELVGVAPWYRESMATRGRVLRFLGDATNQAVGSHWGLLTTVEHEESVASSIAGWLRQSHASANDGWDLLDLTRMLPGENATERFLRELNRHQISVYRGSQPAGWQVALPRDWETFCSHWNKSQRKQQRRWETQAVRYAGLATWHRERANEAFAFSLLRNLHARRARELNVENRFMPGKQSQFLEEVFIRLMREQLAELHWLEWEGSPAAAEWHVLGSSASYVINSVSDPAFLAHEPERFLQGAYLRGMITEGLHRVEFLTEHPTCFFRTMATPRLECNVHAVPPRTGPHMRHGAWWVGETMRSWWKQGLAFQPEGR